MYPSCPVNNTRVLFSPPFSQIPTGANRSRTHLAGYKIPRQLTLVEGVQRSPSGKPDYPWAQMVASAG